MPLDIHTCDGTVLRALRLALTYPAPASILILNIHQASTSTCVPLRLIPLNTTRAAKERRGSFAGVALLLPGNSV